MYTYTVFGISFDVTNAHQFIKYQVALITTRYGTNLDTSPAPSSWRYKARLLGYLAQLN